MFVPRVSPVPDSATLAYPVRLPSQRGRIERRLLLICGVAALALVAAGPLLLDTYSVSILIRSFLYGAIAVTVDILWGFTGILSFGQAAFFGIGAYALGLAVTQYDFTAPIVTAAMIGGPLVAAATAWLVAWLGFGPRVSPLYISVITLVLSVIFVQVIYSGGDFTGSSSGLSDFDTFDISMEGWFRIAGACLVVVTAPAGSSCAAISAGCSSRSARTSSVAATAASAPRGSRPLLLVGSAIVAALAGFAYAGYNDVIAPDLGNFQFGTRTGDLGCAGRARHPGRPGHCRRDDRLHQRLSQRLVALHLAAHHRLGVHRGDRAAAAGPWSSAVISSVAARRPQRRARSPHA